MHSGHETFMTRTLLRRTRKLFRDTRGANIMEAAVLTPLLFMLTIGLFEFSSLLYVFLSLQNGASLATRSIVTTNLAGAAREAAVKQAMKDATPTLKIADNGFSFSHMPGTGGSWTSGVGGPGDVGKVTVTYTWNFYTPLMKPFFKNNSITLQVESAMRNEPKFQ
jgi:Flp pilus assembly protein TadG